MYCITQCARIFAYIYNMVVFIALTGLIICVALCYWWVKAVGAFFNWIQPKKNPYVEVHKAKIKNDIAYQDYLNWLDRNGGDMPFDKWKTKEEMDFERKLNQTQKFKL